MKQVYVLTYIDTADFDKVLHQSVHPSHAKATLYAQEVVYTTLAQKVGKDWEHALDFEVTALPYFE